MRSGVFFTPTATAAIDAGDGDDYVYAWGQQVNVNVALGHGNDYLILGSNGSSEVSLGQGHDVIELASGSGATVRITDFTAGDDGDRIDLSRSLQMLGISHEPDRNPFADSRIVLLRQVGADVEIRLGIKAVILLQNVRLEDLTATNFSGAHPDGRPMMSGGNFFGSARCEQTWSSHGDDIVEGLAGDDQIFALGGDDEVFGGDGDDELDGGSGDDTLHGGGGDDALSDAGQSIPGGNETYYGGAGDDQLIVTPSSEAADWARLFGEDGDDSLGSRREVGELLLDGGSGNDAMLVSNADHWRADGGAGDDMLSIAGVQRGAGMFFGEGVFDGGQGHDIVVFGENADALDIVFVDEDTFRIGDSLFHNVEGFRFQGGFLSGDFVRDLSGAPRGLSIEGWSGDDILTGTRFDDTLTGNWGQDALNGRAGYDTAVFEGDFAHYSITRQSDGSTVVEHVYAPGALGPDTLRNIERLQFDDGWYTLDGEYLPAVVRGTDASEEISGMGWSDTLFAGAGDDLIRRTGGDDMIDGGAGTDIFEIEHLSVFYRLLQDGDDFLLKSDMGDSIYLTGVEIIRFADRVVELHRTVGPETFAMQGPEVDGVLAPSTRGFGGGAVKAAPDPWRGGGFDLVLQDVETGSLAPFRDDHFF